MMDCNTAILFLESVAEEEIKEDTLELLNRCIFGI